MIGVSANSYNYPSIHTQQITYCLLHTLLFNNRLLDSGHVAHSSVVERSGERNAEAGLHSRLIPTGEGHTSIRRLELCCCHILLNSIHHILAAVESLEIVIQVAAENHVEGDHANLQFLLELENNALVLLQNCNSTIITTT